MRGELHSSLCMSENLYFTLTPVGTLHADLPPERFPSVYAGIFLSQGSFSSFFKWVVSMKIFHVHCSSSFISKDQFSLLSTLQGQPQLLLEDSRVYCKWCVNFFILANRRMQALLCHFTPCAGQIPIHVIAFHSSLLLCGFPHPSPPCLPQQWGYIALCHEAAIRSALRWLLCAFQQGNSWRLH